MSSIEKMSIQGIRSFGPEDKEKQIITFFAPLTLILGPNGTGKTTVIECLKYMTTGEMPPGTRQGGAFIHDPKVAHEREVKAQVRLQFKDVRGQTCIATRSMVATQKVKKVEMKTLEGLITRRLPDGSKQSVSSRCAEMDREMVALLGVAKPVLENVIFCHQEDSNWPLSEGKALKQKFDDIFASTRYVKALEAIRKFRQEQRSQIQLFGNEIKYLKQNQEKAAEIRGNLEQTEGRYIASKENVQKLETDLEPVETKLQTLNNKSQDIYRLHTKVEKLKSERSQMEKSMKELQEKIENEFQGSTEELRRALSEFQTKVKEREDKLDDYEGRNEALALESHQLSERKGDLLLEQGKLEQEAEQHKKRIQKRDALIRRVAQEYELGDYSGAMTERQVAKFLKELEEKGKKCMAKAKATRDQFDEKEANKQKELDNARSNKTKLETEQKMKQAKIKENQEEIRNLNKKLSEVDASGDRLKDLDRDLRRAEVELTDAEKSVNVDSLKSEVAELQKQKSELDANLKVLDTEMNKLSLESSARAQLDSWKKDKTKKKKVPTATLR